MSIEEYLDRCDAYRSTTIPDLPYPLKIEPSPEIEATTSALRGEIDEILEKTGIPLSSVAGHTITKPGYPGRENPRHLVHVLLPNDVPIPNGLGSIRDKIQMLLRRHDISLDVEIVSLGLTFRPVLCPIPPEDLLVHVYERARGTIVVFWKKGSQVLGVWFPRFVFRTVTENSNQPLLSLLIHEHGQTGHSLRSASAQRSHPAGTG